MVPVVDEGDGGEGGDGGDEDPGDDEAERPQRLPRVQAHVAAAPPAAKREIRKFMIHDSSQVEGWAQRTSLLGTNLPYPYPQKSILNYFIFR